jgi:hypothetical protein
MSTRCRSLSKSSGRRAVEELRPKRAPGRRASQVEELGVDAARFWQCPLAFCPGKGPGSVLDHCPVAQVPLEIERVAHEQGGNLLLNSGQVLVLSLGARSGNPMESLGEVVLVLSLGARSGNPMESLGEAASSSVRWNDPSRDVMLTCKPSCTTVATRKPKT